MGEHQEKALKIISYAEAKAQGLKRYFTGKPCKNGHRSERMVSHCGCIACAYERTREWGLKTENKAIKFEIHKGFIARNPGYNTTWVRNNKDAQRKFARKWYNKNAQAQIKKATGWRKSNRERARVIVRNRIARVKNALGTHTAEQVVEMLQRQNWECVGCGASIKKKRHIDHKMPLLLGGSNDISNLQGLCPRCNCSKNAKHPDVWAREMGITL